MTAEPVFNHEWKLARAVEHFKALEKEVRSWATGDPYSIAGERKHDGETVLSIESVNNPPPRYWSSLVGDCLYNLRSTLDHLVYELALAYNGGQPLPDDVAKDLEFPIFGTRRMKDGERKRKIGALSPAAQAVIEGMQPHRYGERYT